MEYDSALRGLLGCHTMERTSMMRLCLYTLERTQSSLYADVLYSCKRAFHVSFVQSAQPLQSLKRRGDKTNGANKQ